MAGMEVVFGEHTGLSQERLVASQEMPEHFIEGEVKTLVSPNHILSDAQFSVRSIRNWSVFREGLSRGCHMNAPVRCSCSRLTARMLPTCGVSYSALLPTSVTPVL